MRNEIDERFINILKKYDLYLENIPNDSKRIRSILVEEFVKKCSHKNVALWGVGQTTAQKSHASVILNDYVCDFDGEIKCIIDGYEELWGKTIGGIEIVSPNRIKEYGVEVIIITSKSSAKSIIQDIQKYAPECDYIDIYGVLEKNGIKIYHEFFREASAYTLAYNVRKEYEDAKEDKAKKMHELLEIYCYLRDFYYMRKFHNSNRLHCG